MHCTSKRLAISTTSTIGELKELVKFQIQTQLPTGMFFFAWIRYNVCMSVVQPTIQFYVFPGQRKTKTCEYYASSTQLTRKDRLACCLEGIDLNNQQDVWSLDTSSTLGWLVGPCSKLVIYLHPRHRWKARWKYHVRHISRISHCWRASLAWQ